MRTSVARNRSDPNCGRHSIAGLLGHCDRAQAQLTEVRGNLLRTLEANGELDTTVFAFSSDNGYMMGEHRLHAGKTVPYEASSRVPLILRGPGFPAGSRERPSLRTST